ncbi:MAG: RnfABCDGE type electron transport complex subunit D [Spirochaetes bacterium]|nr:RnfABCDGE type electron transport complex subunit D [Spirochaetota bacterium]
MTETKNTSKKEEMLVVALAPHISSGESIPRVMWQVVAALVPAAAFSAWLFGPRVLLVMGVAVVSAVLAEACIQLLLKKRVTALDGSAAITGLLLAMNLPATAPLWMTTIGSFFAIIIAKQLFGGLGFNIFNPALAARAFLMASWPIEMTARWPRFSETNALSPVVKNIAGFPPAVYDALTQATPLGIIKEGPKILADNNIGLSGLWDMIFSRDMLGALFTGNVGGCLGETSVLLLLAGGVFLLARKIITWHVPLFFIGTFTAAVAAYYYFSGFPAPHLMVAYNLLSGGLFLGAFFMATDMVTSPVSAKGMMLFGAGCGLITFVIRIWGGYPEGVSYSILIMNAFVPLIDRYIKPKVFGTTKKIKGGAV